MSYYFETGRKTVKKYFEKTNSGSPTKHQRLLRLFIIIMAYPHSFNPRESTKLLILIILNKIVSLHYNK